VEKLSINKLKWIRNLHSKKFRDSEGYFIAEGEKILTEILEFAPASIYLIVCTQDSLEKIKQHAAFDIFIASPSEFERISLLKSPQEILIIFKNTLSEANKLDPTKSILVLDNIQDPGNLGTILRTADWFGINQIYCSQHTVDCCLLSYHRHRHHYRVAQQHRRRGHQPPRFQKNRQRRLHRRYMLIRRRLRHYRRGLQFRQSPRRRHQPCMHRTQKLSRCQRYWSHRPCRGQGRL
jgi:hypothetical protein